MRSRPIARQKSGNLKAPTRQQAVSAWSDSIQVRPAPWEAQLINLLDGRLKSFAFGTKGRKIQLGHVWANLLAECGQIQLCERRQTKHTAARICALVYIMHIVGNT
jgi:hypothetical protein